MPSSQNGNAGSSPTTPPFAPSSSTTPPINAPRPAPVMPPPPSVTVPPITTMMPRSAPPSPPAPVITAPVIPPPPPPPPPPKIVPPLSPVQNIVTPPPAPVVPPPVIPSPPPKMAPPSPAPVQKVAPPLATPKNDYVSGQAGYRSQATSYSPSPLGAKPLQTMVADEHSVIIAKRHGILYVMFTVFALAWLSAIVLAYLFITPVSRKTQNKIIVPSAQTQTQTQPETQKVVASPDASPTAASAGKTSSQCIAEYGARIATTVPGFIANTPNAPKDLKGSSTAFWSPSHNMCVGAVSLANPSHTVTRAIFFNAETGTIFDDASPEAATLKAEFASDTH